MRKVDIPLRHKTDIVVISIVLQNMCTIGKDKFDIELIKEVER